MAIASTPQNITRTAPRQITAPPTYAATDPSNAKVATVAKLVTRLTDAVGATAQAMIGTTAPTANAAAEDNDACTGRAIKVSVIPNSSRAWVPRASLAVS